MSPKLIDLPLEPLDEGVTDALEGALKLAREGKLSSVAIIAIERDGVPHFWRSEMRTRSLMIGAITRLLHQAVREADEE